MGAMCIFIYTNHYTYIYIYTRTHTYIYEIMWNYSDYLTMRKWCTII